MENDHELNITDLIDVDVLQRMQDAFSNLTGMAALTTDVDGIPVTIGSNFSEFCMKYTRTSLIGNKRCEQCDKLGAEITMKNGKATAYFCHAGLVDFAAPIVTHGKHVGCFIGGQVLAEPPDLEHMRQVAEEIGVDPEEYIAAARKVTILDKNTIDKAAEFLYQVSGILSDIAYGRYMEFLANEEIEKAGKMKSDFLANMSHEIRTPMNAVIGMAEMALREELPPTARDYINQIKASGRALLTIINDILDFSKIESGKMDICPVEYEPMSIVNDAANIIMTRLHEKNVELILDIRPDIPNKLLGDNIRIKQVLINIANNAVKFTQKGKVAIKIDYRPLSEGEVEIEVAVEDTGIGIKKQDLDKLFQSFQQVDSKRNRNIEGTGLGLAISKQLLTLMGGDIYVESEYGKGSRFFFVFPQKVIDDTPSIKIEEPEKLAVAGFIANEFVKKQLSADCLALGVDYADIETEEEFLARVSNNQDKEHFLFIEKKMFTAQWEEFAKNHPALTVVLVIDFSQTVQYNISNLLVIKKPVYILNLATLLKHEELYFSFDDSSDVDFDFIAPKAEILVVDDNAINLTVVEGLLEPLKMKIDTALSGKEAIEKISDHRYDIVFMDHMMPELDGVETTHIIRRFHEEYHDIPIIALSANAVSGMKEMFLQEGMNDFVAKPIELRMLVSKVKQWLPVEKIQRVYDKDKEQRKPTEQEPLTVGDLDTKSAIKLLGTEKLFWTILKDYYRVIEKKAKLIKEQEEREDWAGYTIEVHALKSSSKQIGAMELSDMAAEMERAGNARDSALIHRKTDELLKRYRGYISVLQPFFQEKEADERAKAGLTQEILQSFFEKMQEAVDDLDMDRMEAVIGDMERYHYDDWQKELFLQLKNAVEDIDTDACEAIIGEWKEKI